MCESDGLRQEVLAGVIIKEEPLQIDKPATHFDVFFSRTH